jgi:hypothetical protein
MFSRSTIAVGAVLAALGALAAVALASGGEAAPTTAPAPSAETDPPVQVRTKVIRRTVHVRPKAAASSSDDGTLDQGPGDRPQIPVASAPAAVATVSGHDVGDDHGRHHGGDDDFDDDHSGHGGGGDDDSGHGRGRGRGGDDD